MKYIDDFLNRITMYRLVVYALVGYSLLAVVLSFLGKFSFTPTALVVSLALVAVPAYAVEKLFGRLFHTPTNSESWLITSLIIFLIVQPAHNLETGIMLALAGGVSSASKHLISWNGRHIFNPAAFAAALVSLTTIGATTWWIGSSTVWPITAVVGLAIIYKVRRLSMSVIALVVAVVLQAIVFKLHGLDLGDVMKNALFASPLIFMGSIMLTEPATMPPRRLQQMIFGALVAVLYVMAWKVGPLYIYPEVALLIGNIYAFAVAPKFKVRLVLQDIQRVSDRVYNYVFRPDRRFNFRPGQYMEWTLAGVPFDSRGNRRSFTIASSPTEDEVHLGVKYYAPPSAYKSTLGRMKLGDSIYASQLQGSFTIHPHGQDKLAFIAGGIGITPFRSMVKYLLDNDIHRDIVLLYVVSSAEELAYHDVFVEAQRIGLRYVPVITQPGQTIQGAVNAKLSQDLIAELVPDGGDRMFYISGPNRMVDGTKHYLTSLGVPITSIRTDHFSGY